MMIKKTLLTKKGFTIPELLVAVLLLISIFTGAMLIFVKCLELSDLASNSSTAVLAVKNKLTEIENTSFSQIYTNYNNTAFNISGLNGKGISYVDNSDPSLLSITVVISWKQINGRLIGEDVDLDGQLDLGEDKNGNGRLDSLVQLTTLKYGT